MDIALKSKEFEEIWETKFRRNKWTYTKSWA